MAPAFTNGVEGWSFSSKMAMMELNGSPVASAPNHVQHFLCTVLAQDKDGRVYLRDGLYTETIVCVTYIDGLPVHQADAESE